MASLLMAGQGKAQEKRPLAIGDIQSWTCRARSPIDDHFSAMIEVVVLNPEAAIGGTESEATRPHYYIHWQEKPGYIAQSVVAWGPVDLSIDDPGMPKRIEFSVPGPQMKSGALDLRSDTPGLALTVAADRLEWLAPTFHVHWLKLQDPSEIAVMMSGSGWRMRYTDRDLGDTLLPRWTASRAAYKVLRKQLVGAMDDPAANCHANPVDYDAAMMEVI